MRIANRPSGPTYFDWTGPFFRGRGGLWLWLKWGLDYGPGSGQGGEDADTACLRLRWSRKINKSCARRRQDDGSTAYCIPALSITSAFFCFSGTQWRKWQLTTSPPHTHTLCPVLPTTPSLIISFQSLKLGLPSSSSPKRLPPSQFALDMKEEFSKLFCSPLCQHPKFNETQQMPSIFQSTTEIERVNVKHSGGLIVCFLIFPSFASPPLSNGRWEGGGGGAVL